MFITRVIRFEYLIQDILDEMENEKQILQIEELKFWYTGKGFQLEISKLKINKGSKVAILGKSGSGKTSLLMLMSGLEKPTSGKIIFNNVNFSEISEKKKTQIFRT